MEPGAGLRELAAGRGGGSGSPTGRSNRRRDLRWRLPVSALDGDEASPEAEDDEDGGGSLSELLTAQAKEAGQLLARQRQRALRAAERELAEARRQAEEEATELRLENQRLRAMVSHGYSGHMASTGEVFPGTGEASYHDMGCQLPLTAQSGPQGVRLSPSGLQRHSAKPAPPPPEPQVDVAAPPDPPSALEAPELPGTVDAMQMKQAYAAKPNQRAGRSGHRPVGSSSSDSVAVAEAIPAMRARPATKSNVFGSGERMTGQRAPRNSNRVFQDVEAIKERVRLAIHEEEYNVTNFYHTEGTFQKIARSHAFELVTLFVISLNAVWMSIEADHNNAAILFNAHVIFQIAEHFFCTYFTLEVGVRFMAFQSKVRAMKDLWFIFDFVLVVLMITETWVLSVLIALTTSNMKDASLGDASILKILRLLRLTRMARVVRLLRACPELMILIKGVIMAGRPVFFTLCLLVSIIYVFGIAFTLLTRGTSAGVIYFDTVADSMNTLLLHGCFGENLPDVANALGKESVLLGALLLVFVLLSSLTVMNMLMGILVEVVSVVAAIEKETSVVNFVKERLQNVIDALDPEFDHHISRDLFTVMLEHPEALKALQEVGVDVVGLIDFSDYIFIKGDTISFSEFMETVLQLRGSNKATVKDIVDLRKCVVQELARLEQPFRARHLSSGSAPRAARPERQPLSEEV